MEDINNQNNQEPIEQTPKQNNIETEITKEEKNEKNSFKNSFITNSLITLLICVFGLSLISAAYIIFNPSVKKTEAKQQKISESKFSFKKIDSSEPGSILIKVRGVIQESSDNRPWSSSQNASALAARIRDLAEDKNVNSLLLDINSPGGTVASVQDIYNAILYFKSKNKPVVALFRDVAASGGYYIATAADAIVAQPGTITGSIGVIMQGANFAPLLEKIGVSFKPIKSAKHKDIGSPYREMTEEEEHLLQDMINDTYAQFFDAVKKARPNIPEENLRIYADGRVWTGSQAKALGLIDELGGLEKAKEILKQKTGVKDLKIRDINNSPLQGLRFFFNSAQSKLDTKLEDISTPKVSYLWTY